MATKVRTNVYLDKELKDKAKELFKEYGLSLSDALNIFLAQVVRKKELPLEEVIPEETLKVIKEAREGKNMRQLTLEEFREMVNETAGGS
jgi:DNA-damage-inducible protein J